MTSPNEQLRLNAFIDGELALDEQLQIEARLREDATLRAQVERMRAMREAVRERADYHAAPAALRSRVAEMVARNVADGPVADVLPQPSRASLQQHARASWWQWQPWAAAAFASVAVFAIVNFGALSPREDERIEGEVLASHVRATLGQRAVDVASSDHHTVKPWLSGKLDFSPPVTELRGTPTSAPGSALLGGRVDYIGGRPVAALAYRYAGHMVDDYIWPSRHGDYALKTASTRGFNIAHWSSGGMTHWLVSDLNPVELAQLARELGEGN